MLIWTIQHILEVLELFTPIILLVLFMIRERPLRGSVGEDYLLHRRSRKRTRLVLRQGLIVMSYWNYRVTKTTSTIDGEAYYQLKEVYYDDDDKVTGFSEDAVGFGGDSVDELKDSLLMAMSAFDKPVLLEDGL